MVDEIRVLRLLRRIADDTDVLRRESGSGPERQSDPIWLRGIKYTFVTAIEGCVDVAQHVCSAERWGPPEDNGQALRLLGDHAVLPLDLATAMRQAVGFRNILVHDYAEVSNDIVRARLADVSDLEAFVRALTGYLGSDRRS